MKLDTVGVMCYIRINGREPGMKQEDQKMKKIAKYIGIILCVAMVAGLLAACGGSDSPAVGKWEGKYTKYVGDDEKNTSEDFSLVLKAGGKGVSTRDGLDLNVTWTLDGEDFTMTETFLGIKIEYTGTLKDGVIDIFNGDPDDAFTCEYVYEK